MAQQAGVTGDFEQLYGDARAWLASACAAGWLDERHQARLAAIERASPGDLFAQRETRPLVVALFGGTGVGKSSLLNRLAGEEIARVGVERPTSYDITLYAHRDVELGALPDELPLDRIQVRRHENDNQRQVLWIDAPDIDSVEEANRRNTLAWLPHVDLLCYVVSPERYRDDVGWRVLRDRGHRHGWLFVMNRWDEGAAPQREDFLRMLREAGFADPVLKCTTCRVPSPPLPTADEFDQIASGIDELVEARGVEELGRLGHRARVQELRGTLAAFRQPLGAPEDWSEVAERLEKRWGGLSAQLAQGVAWIMQTAAARFAVRETGWVQQVGRRLAGGSPAQVASDGAEQVRSATAELDALIEPLWDDWNASKLAATLDAVEVVARRRGIHAGPLRTELDQAVDGIRQIVLEPVQDQVRATLLQPENRLVRMLRRVTGFLLTGLPAVALAVVAYFAVTGYYRATRGLAPYLGTDFAVHSALLVLAAWGVPFLLDRLLKPSLEDAVLRAMRRGYAAGLAAAGSAVEEALGTARQSAEALRDRLDALIRKADGMAQPSTRGRSAAISRVLKTENSEESAVGASGGS